MFLSTLLLLIVTVFILALAPAPSVFLVVSRASSHGLVAAMMLIIGLVLGDAIFLLLVLTGLVVTAQLFAEWFVLINIMGGAYLLFLAGQLLNADGQTAVANAISSESVSGLFSGLLLTLSDPRAMLFYAGLLPAHVIIDQLTVSDMTLLVLAILLSVALAKTIYAVVAVMLKRRMNLKRDQLLNRLSAMILAATGIYLWWLLLERFEVVNR